MGRQVAVLVGAIAVLVLSLAIAGSSVQADHATTTILLPSVRFPPSPTPTATPTLPTFNDDFSNPNSGWPVSEDSIAKRGYLLGEYQIYIKKSLYLIRANHNLYAGDFQLQVDVRAASYDSGTCGFYFGYDNGSYYDFEVGYGEFYLARYDASSHTWTYLIPPTYPEPVPIPSGTAVNHLQANRSGSTITLYIDGRQLAQIDDNTLGAGYLGLVASTYGQYFDGRFDNFSFIGAPAPTATPTPTNTPNPNLIPVGHGPFGVAVNPTTNKIYVTNQDDSSVTVIDANNGNATSTVHVGSAPYGVAVNPTTNQVYVSSLDHSVTVIDANNGNATSTIAVGFGTIGVAVNPSTNKVYVSMETLSLTPVGNITVIDVNHGNTTSTVTTPPYPGGLAVNPVTNQVYVPTEYDGNVTVIDANQGNATSTIAVGGFPANIAVNSVTNRIYVVSVDGDLTTIDANNGNATNIVGVGYSANSIAVDSSRNRVYVVDGHSLGVTVLDTGNRNIPTMLSAPLGIDPMNIAVNPTTNKLYVANHFDNTVTIIDLNGIAPSSTVGRGNNRDNVTPGGPTREGDPSKRRDGTISFSEGQSSVDR